MSVQGRCQICEAATAEHHCRRCGASICATHYDEATGLCTECAADASERGGAYHNRRYMTESDEMSGGATAATRLQNRLLEAGPLWAGALVSILVFLFAVQLLGAATEAAEPLIARTLSRVVVDDGSAIGLSWLTTYGLTNGSVVAALALSLLRSGIVSTTEAFLMISGTRLGGAAIVVLIGALDYLHKRQRRTLSEGVSLGLLTFLVTFTIYVPATVLGLVTLTTFRSELLAATRGLDLSVRSLQYFDPITDAITRTLGPETTLVLALALLFGSLWLFDQVLERVETETVRTYVFQHFEQRWMAFGIGLVITGVTTSVAFSLGVVVPLYNGSSSGARRSPPTSSERTSVRCSTPSSWRSC